MLPRRREEVDVLAWWQAIVLGLVEGITEYLPVSSTGHLILTSQLLGLERPDTKEALDAFLVVVQGGAILAVLGLYRERVAQMIRGVLGRDARGLRLVIALVVAFLPAAVAGLLLNKTIKALLFSTGPVVLALGVGGVFMLWLGRQGADRGPGRQDVADVSPATALAIGCWQVLALWPGTSRSMVTIGGGILLWLDVVAAAEFSFLLGLPTLGAACAHDLVSLLKTPVAGGPSAIAQLGAGPMLLGVAVATVSAAAAVRWLVGFLVRHGLAPFGWYRIALAAVLGALVAGGVVHVG